MAKKNIEFELVRAMRTPRRLTHSLLRVKPPSTSINCHSLVKRLYISRGSRRTSCSVMRRESDIIRIKYMSFQSFKILIAVWLCGSLHIELRF